MKLIKAGSSGEKASEPSAQFLWRWCICDHDTGVLDAGYIGQTKDNTQTMPPRMAAQGSAKIEVDGKSYFLYDVNLMGRSNVDWLQ